MARKYVIINVIVVLLLSGLAIYYINDDVCATKSDYISSVGSVASIYAILIMLWQFVKKTDEIKEAVAAKTNEISSFLTYAEIEKHKEMCNSIYNSINGCQYEAAAMKLDDIRILLIEMREQRTGCIDKNTINKIISDIGNDSVNLRNCWVTKEKLDNKIIFKHINSVSNVLSNLSANLKNEQL